MTVDLTYEERRELVQDFIDLITHPDKIQRSNNIKTAKTYIEKRKLSYIEVDGTRIYCTPATERIITRL